MGPESGQPSVLLSQFGDLLMVRVCEAPIVLCGKLDTLLCCARCYPAYPVLHRPNGVQTPGSTRRWSWMRREVALTWPRKDQDLEVLCSLAALSSSAF